MCSRSEMLGVLVLAIQRFGVVSVVEEILINHNGEEHGVKNGYDLQQQRTPVRRNTQRRWRCRPLAASSKPALHISTSAGPSMKILDIHNRSTKIRNGTFDLFIDELCSPGIGLEEVFIRVMDDRTFKGQPTKFKRRDLPSQKNRLTIAVNGQAFQAQAPDDQVPTTNRKK